MFYNESKYSRYTKISWSIERIIREVKIPRFRFTGTSIAIFILPIFADVNIFTRNFYPFPRGKPWSTRKRQTGTGVFCLLFVGRLNSKNFQHLTQINNAHSLSKCSTIYSNIVYA